MKLLKRTTSSRYTSGWILVKMRVLLSWGGLYALCFCEESGKKGGKDTPSACLKSGEKEKL